MLKEVGEAAQEVAVYLGGQYRSPDGLHAETVIGAAAAITGEWALWACGLPLPDSAWVSVPETDTLLVEGPNAASRLIAAAVLNAGGLVDKLPSGPSLVARTAASVGSRFPPLTVDRRHFPREWSPLAAPRFRADVRRIAEAHAVTEARAVFMACALATAFLISASAGAVDPTVAGTLALEVMVAVSRMSPSSTERMLRDVRAGV